MVIKNDEGFAATLGDVSGGLGELKEQLKASQKEQNESLRGPFTEKMSEAFENVFGKKLEEIFKKNEIAPNSFMDKIKKSYIEDSLSQADSKMKLDKLVLDSDILKYARGEVLAELKIVEEDFAKEESTGDANPDTLEKGAFLDTILNFCDDALEEIRKKTQNGSKESEIGKQAKKKKKPETKVSPIEPKNISADSKKPEEKLEKLKNELEEKIVKNKKFYNKDGKFIRIDGPVNENYIVEIQIQGKKSNRKIRLDVLKDVYLSEYNLEKAPKKPESKIKKETTVNKIEPISRDIFEKKFAGKFNKRWHDSEKLDGNYIIFHEHNLSEDGIAVTVYENGIPKKYDLDNLEHLLTLYPFSEKEIVGKGQKKEKPKAEIKDKPANKKEAKMSNEDLWTGEDNFEKNLEIKMITSAEKVFLEEFKFDFSGFSKKGIKDILKAGMEATFYEAAKETDSFGELSDDEIYSLAEKTMRHKEIKTLLEDKLVELNGK